MSFETLILLIAGLIALLVGAEGLVRGASRLAARVGISPLVIGLTVVALGTSSPEIAVSVGASLKDQGDIALGNVIGSNIFNVLFILGLSALITPLIVQQQLVRLDVPLMIIVSGAVWLLAQNGRLGMIEGVLLLSTAVAYTLFLIRQSRRETNAAVQSEYQEEFGEKADEKSGGWIKNVAFILVGLALLVAGAGWLVEGAVNLARAFGVSELMIGLTVIAAGTSLPEVATSVLAAVRGERDIAVGNVVGSNLFNLMAVLGIAAIVSPQGIEVRESVRDFDLPVMFAVALACLPIFFTGHRIGRWEGALFFAYYILYTVWLVLSARGSYLTETFADAMLFFVLPLTFITLAMTALREWRSRA